MAKVGRINNSASSMAREYIKENIEKKETKEIVDYLRRITTLNISTIERIYRDIKSERDREAREEIWSKTIEERSKIKYKDRKRTFFYIDDTKLYHGLIKQ